MLIRLFGVAMLAISVFGFSGCGKSMPKVNMGNCTNLELLTSIEPEELRTEFSLKCTSFVMEEAIKEEKKKRK